MPRVLKKWTRSRFHQDLHPAQWLQGSWLPAPLRGWPNTHQATAHRRGARTEGRELVLLIPAPLRSRSSPYRLSLDPAATDTPADAQPTPWVPPHPSEVACAARFPPPERSNGDGRERDTRKCSSALPCPLVPALPSSSPPRLIFCFTTRNTSTSS